MMYAHSGANEHGHGGEARSPQASSVRAGRADRMTDLRAAHNARERLAAGHVLGPADIVGLQRLAGNRAVSAAVSRGQRDAALAADIDAGTDSASPIRDVAARSGPPLDHTQTRHAAEPATVQRLVVFAGRCHDPEILSIASDRASQMAKDRGILETHQRARTHVLSDNLLNDPELLPDNEVLVIVERIPPQVWRFKPTFDRLSPRDLYGRLVHAGWTKRHFGLIVFQTSVRRSGSPLLKLFSYHFATIAHDDGRLNDIVVHNLQDDEKGVPEKDVPEKDIDDDWVSVEAEVVPGTQTVPWNVAAPRPLNIWNVDIGNAPLGDPLLAPSYQTYRHKAQKAEMRGRDRPSREFATGKLTPVAFAYASTPGFGWTHSQFVFVVDDRYERLGWVKLGDLLSETRPPIVALTGLKLKNKFDIPASTSPDASVHQKERDRFIEFTAALKINFEAMRGLWEKKVVRSPDEVAERLAVNPNALGDSYLHYQGFWDSEGFIDQYLGGERVSGGGGGERWKKVFAAWGVDCKVFLPLNEATLYEAKARALGEYLEATPVALLDKECLNGFKLPAVRAYHEAWTQHAARWYLRGRHDGTF